MNKVTETVAKLAAPVAAEYGCEIWDVEYVREAGTWYLRVYIDKDGGVGIDDCEKISRALSPMLDETDPIAGSYTFEVSSAGAERQLKHPSDFARFIGSPVTVRLYKNRDGRKEFLGVLSSYDDGAVEIDCGGTPMRFEKAEIALVRLRIEF